MEIKDLIKTKRIEKDLTMKQLAEAVGVSEATISRWESGDIANMRRDKLYALAKKLEISPATLMGMDDPHKVIIETNMEEKLLDIFRSLNNEGKEQLLLQAHLLELSDNFKKGIESEQKTAI